MKRKTLPIAALALLAASPAVFAQTFFDGDFAESDWVMTLFTKGVGGSSGMTRQATGGNPDAFASIRNQVFDGGSTTAQIFALYLKSSASWNPGTQGRIMGVTFSQDTKLINGSGVGQGGSLVIYQGGRFFTAGSFGCPETDWTTKTSDGTLTAADFRLVDPFGVDFGGAGTPDFSRGAAPVVFGFGRSNSQSGGGAGTTQIVGTDNWTVNIIAGVNPSSVRTTRGVFQTGDVNSLADPDQDWYQVQARPQFIIAASAEIEATGNLTVANPSSFTFTLVANATGTPSTQRTELFNYDTNSWEVVDSRPATTTNSTVTVVVDTNPGRFINDADREVKARVGYFDNNVPFPGWRGRVDQVLWSYAS